MRNIDGGNEVLTHVDPIEAVKRLDDYRFDGTSSRPIAQILWKLNECIVIENGDEDQEQDVEKVTMAMKDFLQRMKDWFVGLSIDSEEDLLLLKSLRDHFFAYDKLLYAVDCFDTFERIQENIAVGVAWEVILKTKKNEAILSAWGIAPLDFIDHDAQMVYLASFALWAYPEVQQSVDKYFDTLKRIVTNETRIHAYERHGYETIDNKSNNNYAVNTLVKKMNMEYMPIKRFDNGVMVYRSVEWLFIMTNDGDLLTLQADWSERELIRIVVTNPDGDVFATQMREDAELEIALWETPEAGMQERISWLISETKENCEHQWQDREWLRQYVLPEGPISYVSMIANNDHDLMKWSVVPSLYFGAKLESLVPSLHFDQIAVGSDPLTALEQHLERYSETRDVFYLDFFTHWLKDGLWYAKTKKDVISAKDIYKVIQKYPEKQFVIGTMACYWWALIDGFQDIFSIDESMKEKISVFTQTQDDDVNYLYYRKKDSWGDQFALSTYSQHLLRGLEQWHGFWSAVDMADRLSIPQKYNNAQSLIAWEVFQ